MDKKASITVGVNCKLEVDEDAAKGCLTLVQIYLNANGLKLAQHRRENGEVELSYEPA